MNAFRLLVTRNLSAAAKAAAAATGVIRVTEEPFIKVEPLNSNANRETIRSLAREPLTVIFTSQHAVKNVAAMAGITVEEAAGNPAGATGTTAGMGGIAGMAGKPARKPVTLSWKIFCIAGTTEKLVKKYFGENSCCGSAPYAEELAAYIMAQKPSERIVFFCGNLRRDTLPDILKKNGIALQELVVYTTTLTPRTLEETFDGVAFFSPSAAESFFSANRPDNTVVFFSIGHTTTAALKTYTDNRVITSEHTTEAAMIEAVSAYITKQTNQSG